MPADALRGYDQWKASNPSDADPYLTLDAAEAEADKERDWSRLEAEAREFVGRYGAAAMLRCVSEALK